MEMGTCRSGKVAGVGISILIYYIKSGATLVVEPGIGDALTPVGQVFVKLSLFDIRF